MKFYISLTALLFAAMNLSAQKNYPEPEFSNELCFLKKDSLYTLMRLEKASSSMNSKTKAGGFGGYENGYTVEGERSPVKIYGGANLSFIISNGSSVQHSSSSSDSMMRANGMDPSMMPGMGATGDPSTTTSLYKMEPGKGQRKVFLQKVGGVFGSKKLSSSDKYTFSVKKIREGYWELVIDKTLPKGEYAFTTMSMGMGSMDGSTTLFAFSVQ